MFNGGENMLIHFDRLGLPEPLFAVSEYHDMADRLVGLGVSFRWFELWITWGWEL